MYNWMKLADFPADCQALRIGIESKLPLYFANWVNIPGKEVATAQLDNVFLHDFHLLDNYPFVAQLSSRKDTNTFGGELFYSRVETKIGIRRNEMVYLVNVIAIMFVIASLTLTSFCLHPGYIYG
jgi:hypothetical protein